jgi:hypothetical protein
MDNNSEALILTVLPNLWIGLRRAAFQGIAHANIREKALLKIACPPI